MARTRKNEDVEAETSTPAPRDEASSGSGRGRKKAEKAPRGQERNARGERKPIVRPAQPERQRARRKERRGVVVSNAMEKTIVVRVETSKPDPRYKKVVRRSRNFHAHDERNEANVGDVVRIVETRPLSRTKTWRLAEVVEAAR